jgi:NAD(P)-dependent dehydrogenase (short-subunit alcohol dehydrogenase family)
MGEKVWSMRNAHGTCVQVSFSAWLCGATFAAMSTPRTALVTGANQGLGRALVEGLAAGLQPHDRVLLTGRDPDRVQAAAAAVAAGPAVARVDGRVLDVRDNAAIAALAAELGTVDIVFSNATARMSPDADPTDEVDAVAETSNLATTRMLRAFAPRLQPGGRLIVVASALGTLDKLDGRVAGRFASVAAEGNLGAVDALVADWRAAVHAGRAEDEGYGAWLNIPSKVAQVAAVRALARERRSADLAANRLLMALCPGLIDTDASRPWFEDMASAQTPAQAAAWPVQLALAPTFDPAFYGELVQFGTVLPWETGVPVAHRAA